MTTPRARSIIAAFGIAASSGAALGLSFPLLNLNLDDWGVSPAGIGAFTLAASISTLVATPLAPPLMARLPIRTLAALGLAVIATAFLSYHETPNITAWLGLRAAAGMAFAVLFVAAEAWILGLAPERQRGLVLGLYASAFAGAMALGGAAVAWLGHSGRDSFLAGAACCAVGALFTLLPGPGVTAPKGDAAHPDALVRRIAAAPALMLGPLVMGAIETAKYNLLPIYARDVGFADAAAPLTITAAGFGVLTLQPLIGALADRIGAQGALVVCASVGATAPFAIVAAGPDQNAALAMIFLYSGMVTGIYTTGLIWLGRTFAPDQLAAGNAAYALSYGVGQLAGPAAAGLAYSAVGPLGFLATLAAFSAVYLAVLGGAHAWRARSKP
ncbi:MAG: MFS transporter [Alphaproteobacteria bacterium]|nr:MFS transporter [Alphaproteobacteria bacterium]